MGGSLSSASVNPTSGPNEGATLVTVSALQLGGGSRYNCSFGIAGTVPASYSSPNGTIACVAPALNASRGPQPFLVTLNGQQFLPSSAAFFCTGTPSITLPDPLSGPTQGGTF